MLYPKARFELFSPCPNYWDYCFIVNLWFANSSSMIHAQESAPYIRALYVGLNNEWRCSSGAPRQVTCSIYLNFNDYAHAFTLIPNNIHEPQLSMTSPMRSLWAHIKQPVTTRPHFGCSRCPGIRTPRQWRVGLEVSGESHGLYRDPKKHISISILKGYPYANFCLCALLVPYIGFSIPLILPAYLQHAIPQHHQNRMLVFL